MIIRLHHRIGRGRFIKPRICPDCHHITLLASHPKANRCIKCHQKKHRREQRHNTRFNYRKRAWIRRKSDAIAESGWCALCGSTEHLTVHHAVDVMTGEWQGRHVTVLCDGCHQKWETKVNRIRSLR